MNFILVRSPQLRAVFELAFGILPRMLSNFLLLLFLLPPSLHLLDRSEGLNCTEDDIRCGGPYMKDHYPFIRVDPLNGPCSPQISCSDDLVMKIGSLEYLINLIDYEHQTLLMVNHDYLFFNDPVLLLYNCSSRVQGFNGVHQFPCCNSAEQCYYTAMDPELFESECAWFTYAVVNQMSMDHLMINNTEEGLEGLMAILRLGFEVTWTPQERTGCTPCVQSGGRCTNNSILDDMVFCHCPDNFTHLHICPGQNDPVEVGGCNACVQSGGLCWNHSSLDGMVFCRCPDGSSYLHICPGQKGHETKISARYITIGGILTAGIFLFVCLLLLYFCCDGKLNISIFRGKNGSRKNPKLEAFIEMFKHLAPTRYSYSDVEKMTSCFSHKIGQGGYGGVYKGKLDNGCPVAVKVLNSSKSNGKEFFSEVISIGCTYHINIVSLLGFCLEESTRILIYEFMANGSLEKFIYTEKQAIPSLKWEKLLEIAIGIAWGLDYLHHGCNIGILHFDIKPHNILLDDDMHPKISDFGLAKLCRSAESIISMVGARGTVGYIAPEVFSKNSGGVSSKSDVYSYGMLVLEMVGGRRNLEVQVDNTSEIYFPHWIYKHLNLDGNLKTFRDMTKVEEVIARRMILVGLWCIQIKPTDRPSMSKVLDMLEGRIKHLQTPPMPNLSSTSRSAKHS